MKYRTCLVIIKKFTGLFRDSLSLQNKDRKKLNALFIQYKKTTYKLKELKREYILNPNYKNKLKILKCSKSQIYYKTHLKNYICSHADFGFITGGLFGVITIKTLNITNLTYELLIITLIAIFFGSLAIAYDQYKINKIKNLCINNANNNKDIKLWFKKINKKMHQPH